MTTQPKRKTTTKSRKADTPAQRKPRETKRARLISMLKHAKGADVAALSQKLGWQPHSTRAALTGLRKAGFTIARVEREGSRTASYRITAEPDAASVR